MDLRDTFIYLIGVPAVGKYSTAKEIARLEGARVIDNQLINMPIFSIVGYKGKDHPPIPAASWVYIEKIRRIVLGFIRDEAEPGTSFVFTNVLENAPGDRGLFRKIERIANHRAAVFVPVLLTCVPGENRRRKRSPDRAARLKDTDTSNIKRWTDPSRQFRLTHPNALILDTTDSTPARTARVILQHARRIHLSL